MTNKHNLNFVLTTSQARELDQKTIESGTTSMTLIERAGKAIYHHLRLLYPEALKYAILVGPGKNGADGIVLARLLRESGFDTKLFTSSDPNLYKGDPYSELTRFTGDPIKLDMNFDPVKYDLIIDAIFGTGLNKQIDGELFNIITKINDTKKIIVVSVDMPTGINADTGQILGTAIKANLTITFGRKKPGLLLLPGKLYTGKVIVDNIGFADKIIDDLNPNICENSLELFRDHFPTPNLSDYKYSKGMVAVIGGDKLKSGATKLASSAALRTGAGLVKMFFPENAIEFYHHKYDAIMSQTYSSLQDILTNLDKVNVAILGPGTGVSDFTYNLLVELLRKKIPLILDADGISVIKKNPEEIWKLMHDHVLLTPHLGEFKNLFQVTDNKITDVINAAKLSNANILLKGSDTVIASPKGQAIINSNAPPTLATAGSGDVLAGIIAGMAAQTSVDCIAAATGCFLHSECANQLGTILIADDLVEQIASTIRTLIS